MTFLGMICWPAVWVGMLYALIAWTSQVFVVLFVLPLCYVLYRAVVQVQHVTHALRMQPIIREYAWQVLFDAPRGIDEHPDAEDRGIWIEFPVPSEGSGKGVPLTFVKHHRAFWWLRRIGGPRTSLELKHQLEPLWFAGDPRFLGVVAVPSKSGGAPKRLHFLYRPSIFEQRDTRRYWSGVDPADLERARRAGARVAVAVQPTAPDAEGQKGTEA
ncbi:hypothetical protein [Streptomyces sp. NPDC059787]|uniref:hypothetical protein n=1 Tax=Streptomyces sp. NPDC059787 TaxID=3346947 RepID=UPI00365A557D